VNLPREHQDRSAGHQRYQHDGQLRRADDTEQRLRDFDEEVRAEIADQLPVEAVEPL
jgi:hypothetical protein